ncbi:MAG: TonB-dependent receptor, partial [Cytophagaceae bacterium]|nr:TonB-dependent receptor [Cytophagaceae bacterium]
ENARKGGFGKVTAGVGSEGRAELKGNYNRFNAKQQFSVLGFGNNTNQTGVSWDGFQDFRGSQSFNWNDDADFGFGGGARFFSFGDDDESLTIPIGSRPNRGFSNNAAGRANYNFDAKKTKLSANYFYNQTEQRLDARSTRENFIQNGSYKTTEQSFRKTFNGNHRVSLLFEKNLDSLNTLILIGNGRLNGGDERYTSAQQFFRRGTTPSSRTNLDNATDFNAFVMASTLIYRHKFRKKGRNFAASFGYNLNDTEGSEMQRSVNEFF